jgi:uncharacterized integral membrane protein
MDVISEKVRRIEYVNFITIHILSLLTIVFCLENKKSVELTLSVVQGLPQPTIPDKLSPRS